MKLKMKMKNRSQKYDINRLRSRHGDKYRRYSRRYSLNKHVFSRVSLQSSRTVRFKIVYFFDQFYRVC